VCLQAYLRFICGLRFSIRERVFFAGRIVEERLIGVGTEDAEPLMVRVVENECRALGAEV